MIAKVANTTKEKIQNAFKIKEHALKSTRLNPAGATAHHVLGEWAFGVASISFVERRVAAALFATPPTATYEEALQHYLNAEKACECTPCLCAHRRPYHRCPHSDIEIVLGVSCIVLVHCCVCVGDVGVAAHTPDFGGIT